jgi:hypothetical protein
MLPNSDLSEIKQINDDYRKSEQIKSNH